MNFKAIEEMERGIEYWVKDKNYDLDYVLESIIGIGMPSELQRTDVYYCVQSGIRQGETYAEALDRCYRIHVEPESLRDPANIVPAPKRSLLFIAGLVTILYFLIRR